jgi:cytochrome c oxidase cbb3-type subunit III
MNETPEQKESTLQSEAPIDVEDLRPHIYDGIQEYDKKLPNWWLWTFYGAIIFSIGYWVLGHTMGLAPDPGYALTAKLREKQIEALKNSPVLSDEKLWALSKDTEIIKAGKLTFDSGCASCHRPDLGGLIGPNLKDTEWVHGGAPMVLFKTVNEGILAKGMPAWGPILGQAKITEVVAYILSYHNEGEPVEIKPWVPGGTVPTTAAN